jgi:hypothetical protein
VTIKLGTSRADLSIPVRLHVFRTEPGIAADLEVGELALQSQASDHSSGNAEVGSGVLICPGAFVVAGPILPR